VEPILTDHVFLMKQQAQMSCTGKWKSSWWYCTQVWFTKSKCVVCFNEKHSYWSFLYGEATVVTGETFPAKMENTVLCHVLREKFFR